MRVHFFDPVHMTKTSSTRPCCDRPESEHPAFPVGPCRVRLLRDVRTLSGTLPKGSVISAEAEFLPAVQEVRPPRWGTNELGQFAELDRGETRRVESPAWSLIVPGQSWRTAIPVRWAEEAR